MSADMLALCRQYSGYAGDRTWFFEYKSKPYDTQWMTSQFHHCWKLSGLTKHGNPRPYDLSYPFATNMIRLGVPINTVSKMLGHASVTITLDTYAHVLEEMQEEAVVKMDQDLSKYLSDLDSDIDGETENYNAENYIDDISLEDDENEWEL